MLNKYGFLILIGMAVGGHVCASCFDTGDGGVVIEALPKLVEDVSPKEFCAFTRQTQQVLNQASKLAPVQEKIYLSVKERDSETSYTPGGELTVPRQLIGKANGSEYIKSKWDSHNALVFQYGRAVFLKVLETHFPLLKQTREKSARLVKGSFALRKEFITLTDPSYRGFFEADVPALEKTDRLIAAIDESEQLDSREEGINANLELANFLKLASPYKALFADTFAVLNNEDPKSMARLMKSAYASKEEIALSETRDFTKDHSRSIWPQENQHGFLAPAKSFIWTHHLKASIKTMSANDKKIYLTKLASVLAEELVQLSKGKLAMDFKACNERLFEKLQPVL